MKRWHAVWAGLSSQSYPMMEIIFTVLCSKSAITSGDFRSACIMTPRCMEKKSATVFYVSRTMSPISALPWQQKNTTYIVFTKPSSHLLPLSHAAEGKCAFVLLMHVDL